MLRKSLLGVGVVLVIAGISCALSGLHQQALSLLVLGGILLLGIVYERWRYKPSVGTPAPGWQPTGERFTDPVSGKLTEVWYDPATGTRHYVEPRHKPE